MRIAIVIFLAAAGTDILDGHLARRRIRFDLGKFLDPIADKFLVSAALIVLSRNIWLRPGRGDNTGREFIVTVCGRSPRRGYRHTGAEYGKVRCGRSALRSSRCSSPRQTGTLKSQTSARTIRSFVLGSVEVRTAFSNLTTLSLTANDWKVFGYLVGRGALWESSVILARGRCTTTSLIFPGEKQAGKSLTAVRSARFIAFSVSRAKETR